MSKLKSNIRSMKSRKTRRWWMRFRNEWVTLEHYQGHEVNPATGQIRNKESGRILSSSVNQSGTRYVSVRNTTLNKYENRAIGQLVAETFCKGRSANEDTVLHLDGNIENCAAENLMWSTRWHAMAYHSEIKQMNFSLRQKVQDETGRIYENVGEAARATGCLPSQIDYGMRYNDALKGDAHLNFVHRVYPGSHIFRSA